MASYLPPIPLNQGLFNPASFPDPNAGDGLTLAEANSLFLRFPTAQGTETLSDAIITGKLSTTNPNTKSLVYGYQTTETAGTGEHNTAFGFQAGKGYGTLTTSTGGNSAFGALTMPSITTSASNNTAIGHNALYNLSSGTANTVVGTQIQSNQQTTIGASNTLIGFNAYGIDNIGSVGNTNGATAVGAGVSVSDNCVAVGRSASAKVGNSVALGNLAEAKKNNSIAIGSLSTTSADGCISIGASAGINGSGAQCIAIGSQALGRTDIARASTATDNIMIGEKAGRNITTSGRNIGIGSAAIGGNSTDPTTGINNTGVGYAALYNLTSGENNVAVGFGALQNATTASNNIAMGVDAGSGLITGDNNTLIGRNAQATTGITNSVVIGGSAKAGSGGDVVIGASAGINLNGALRTIAIGNEAIGGGGGRSLVAGGNDNVCIGLNSGRLLNDGSVSTTSAENVALGSNTLGGGGVGPNTTGYANTCIGFQCGRNITSANYNTGIGWKSLGGSELAGVFTGTDNQCFGIQAGARLTTGSGNSFLGSNAGGITTTGEKNVCIGVLSMSDATGTSENTFIGYRAGKALGTGNRNSALGAETVITNGITEATVIGYGATAPASQTITLGRVNTDSVRLNKITPMYSSLPAYTTADIGYQRFVSLTFTTPTNGTVLCSTPTLPIGVWAFSLSMTFTGAYTPGHIFLSTGVSVGDGWFPIVATTASSASATAICVGSAIVPLSTASIYKLTYSATATSTLTVGLYQFTATRIA